ncbi:MAG: type II secretion system protein [Candidatus Gastranaerophilales bacterium]|nr:type II secretion system protein [Candidatus Gastranaerophilales bacterium]
MRQRKFGFTLAEVMIVLSVIGILSAVLMPIAFKSSPDKNIMKFKKAHNVLHNAVRELVSSDKYYNFHSLSYPVWLDVNAAGAGTIARDVDWVNTDANSGPIYFCKSFADVMSAKSVNCDITCYQLGEMNQTILIGQDMLYGNLQDAKKHLDQICQAVLSNLYHTTSYKFNTITTSDNVLFYETGMSFGQRVVDATDACDPDTEMLSTDASGKLVCDDKYGNNFYYSPMCVDIDGFEGPIKPFGYGIRSDGRVLSGARADWWLDRDITKKETDCCPAGLNAEFTLMVTGNLCDEGDTVCTE